MTANAVEILPVGPDDLPTWAALNHRGFLGTHKVSAARLAHLHQQLPLFSFRLARIGGVACGAYRSWQLDLPVPGAATVPTRAIGSLSVLATHRRRGVASGFVGGELAGAREQGAALAVLIPSEAGIYGRFGFGAATETVHLIVDTRRVKLEPSGEITLEATEDDAALRDVAPALYRTVAAEMPGALPRTDLFWDRECGILTDGDEDLHRPAVIARDADGTVVGTASYRVRGDWGLDRHGEIDLRDLTASSPAAYRALWQYLAGLDLTDRLTAADRPVHEPLVWMLRDRRAVTESHRTDFQWLRMLDVPAALAARRAGAPGSVVLQVSDPGGYAAGRWRLDADEEGRIQVTPTGQGPDVTLPAQTLGSIYLGQNPLTRMHSAGLADEHRAGAVRRLDGMLSWAPRGTVGHTWF